MITFVDSHLNRFQDVSIPKTRVLFERYGYKVPAGHPDNTDPNHFNTPSNLGLTPTETLAAGMRVAVRLNQSAAAAAKQAEEAAAASESAAKKEDKASAEVAAAADKVEASK